MSSMHDRWSGARRAGWRLLCAGTALCCLATMAGAQEVDGLAAAAALEQALIRAIQEAERSVVSIARIKSPPQNNVFEDRINAPFGRPLEDRDNPDNPDFIPNDFGAGIVLEMSKPAADRQRKALILTNYHVVKGGPAERYAEGAETTLHVRLADRRGYPAAIHAADPRSDLAVIVINLNPGDADLTPIRFGDASQARKGQLVVALGNAYAIARDGSASASWGMISNISRRPEYVGPKSTDETKLEETIHHLGTLLQVDTRLNIGTSGGALINLRGECIGITTSLAALAGYEKSVGYAIPINAFTRRIISTLQEGKEVEYGFLGVSIVPRMPLEEQVFPRRVPVEGVPVRVMSNSPAARGGVQSGDTITAVNDVPTQARDDLTREVFKLPPGEQARLRVVRESSREPLTLTVQLGKWPVIDEEGIIAAERWFDPWRGLVVDYPTARLKYYGDRYRETYPLGVMVTEIVPQSRAAAADLAVGNHITHVNGKSVSTPAEFYQAVRGAKGDAKLTIGDDKASRDIVIRP